MILFKIQSSKKSLTIFAPFSLTGIPTRLLLSVPTHVIFLSSNQLANDILFIGRSLKYYAPLVKNMFQYG